MDDSSTTYSFDGDASGLLAELRSVRDSLDSTAQKAVAAGKNVDDSLKSWTTSLGAGAFKNLDELTSTLGATDFKSVSDAVAPKAIADGARENSRP